jgi:uncharacterized protein involved in exopolysaccharide biosynthesis
MELNEAARRIVGQHWPLILILVLAGAGAAALLHRGDEKSYTASTRLVLDTNDPESSAEAAAIRDAAKAIATSPAQVKAALGKARITDRDAADVARNHVSVRSLGTSAVLRLSVSDRDRQTAAAASNALAAQLIRTRLGLTKGEVQKVLASLDRRISAIDEELSGLDRAPQPQPQRGGRRAERAQQERNTSTQALRTSLGQRRSVLEAERINLLSTDAIRPQPLVISAATPPDEADSSPMLPDMILGALLGLILGLGLAGLLETMRPTVVGGDALARELDAPLLGRLPGNPDDPASLDKAGFVGERLSLAAEAGDVHDIGLVHAGPEVDLDPLSLRLETISAQTQPELAEVGRGARSAWRNMGEVAGGSSGFRVRPLRPHQPSLNERRALVVVSPEALKKTELAGTHHLLRITGSPVLGVITYAPSRRGRRRRRSVDAQGQRKP